MIGGKTLWGLLLLVLALVGANLALDVGKDSRHRLIRRSALAPNAENAVMLSIVHSADGGFRMAKDQGDWRIESPFNARTDDSSVKRLLDALSFSPVCEELGEADLLRIGRTRNDFGFGESGLAVQIADADGTRTDIRFGAFTPAGDGVYAMVDGINSVFTVSTNVYSAAGVGVSGFRARSIFDVAKGDVTAIDIKRDKGNFLRLVRDGAVWRVHVPREAVAAPDRMDRFLDAVVAARAVDFTWPIGVSNELPAASASLLSGYGLDSDSAISITVKCANDKECTVKFGHSFGTGLVYALAQNDQLIATVADAIPTIVADGMAAFVDTRLFPVEGKAISAISFEEHKVTYLLSRLNADEWKIDAPVAAAADEKVVRRLIDRILELRTVDLDDNGVRVSIGTNVAPVVVSHAALFGDELRPEDLRSREILRIIKDDVRRIVITDGGGAPETIVYDDDTRSWCQEGGNTSGVVDVEALEKLISALDPLRSSSIVKLKVSSGELGTYGLDKPQRVISIDRKDAKSMRRNLMIGDITNGGRYATLGANEAIFVIPSDLAATLTGKVVHEP